jgi:hypothetical protein
MHLAAQCVTLGNSSTGKLREYTCLDGERCNPTETLLHCMFLALRNVVSLFERFFFVDLTHVHK